ncbi:MAG: PaaI family thioesterase [Alphaproteobacteria bacterium]|nr:PaaI family thioesterase [Alphaproteobacteria bacterium]
MTSGADTANSGSPEGFTRLHLPGPFVDINGPLLARFSEDKLRIGIRLEDRHCNAAGICHGGMLATLADLQIAVAMVVQSDIQAFLPTVNLSVDFVAPGRVGDWVEGETEVIRITRNLAFGSCILSTGDTALARASAVCKIPGRVDPRFTLERLLPDA